MPRQPIIVVSSSDGSETEEEPTQAPRLKTPTIASSPNHGKPTTAAAPPPSSLDPIPPPSNSLSSLIPDRRAMEQERRQRVRKRRREQGLASDSDDPSESNPVRPKQRSRLNPVDPSYSSSPSTSPYGFSFQPSSQDKAPASSGSGNRLNPTPSASTDSSSSNSGKASDPIRPEERFWQGAIRVSYNRYASSAEEGTPFASLLFPSTPSSPNGLKEVVMATYDIEMNWLHQHFAPNTKATIILSPSQGDPRSDPSLPGPGIHPIEIFPPWKDCKGWKVCVPRRPKQGFMTMHIKFLLLFFQDHLRLCILTGNLNHFDWERIENSAFIQDFPLRKLEDDDEDPSGGKGKGKGRERSEFKTYLVRVLKSLSLPPDHAAFGYLSRCDFSKAEAKLVASWPEATVLSGWDSIESQGLGRLGKVVRELGIKREKGGVSLEAQGSSLAKYDRKWLEHFHALGSGVDPRGNLPFKTENRSKTSSSEYLRCIGGSVAGVPPTSRRQPPGDLDWPPIKILFPSQSWVERESIEGPNGAGTFFGKTNEFRTSPYKSLFHQPVSKRGAFMIHAKSLLAFQPCASNRILNGGGARVGSHLSGPIRANPPIGWTYLGSANFTRAAHGNITGTLTHPTMSTMNWELGVVLPIYEQDGDDSKPLSAITYKRPCKRYSESDQTWDLNTLE